VPVLPRLRAPKRFTKRGLVAALAVHQHQRLVGAQPAQRRGIDQVRVVRTGLARGVDEAKGIGASARGRNCRPLSVTFAMGMKSTGTVVSVAEAFTRREPTTVIVSVGFASSRFSVR